MADVPVPAQSVSKSWLFGAAILVVIVGSCAFANSFHAPFVFDGVNKVVENPAIRQVWPPWAWLTFDRQPVAYFSFAVDYALYGIEPISGDNKQIDTRGWHATSLMIHLAAGLTLMSIVYLTFSGGRLATRYAQYALPLAAGIACIWVAHPLQTGSVTYMIQRIESLMGLFYLLTLGAFIAAQRSVRPCFWYALSVTACALGMATKEVMITAPLMVLWYDRIFVADSWREITSRRKTFYISLFGTWICLAYLMVFRWSTYGGRAGVVEGVSPLQYALSQPGVITHYLKLSFLPVGQCLDYWWPIAESFWEIGPPSLMIIAMLISTVWCLFRCPSAGFLGLWFFVILSPTSTVVPIHDLAFEHRMYLPLAAVVAAFVIGGVELAGKVPAVGPRGWLLGIIPVFVLACVVLTFNRNETYQSDEAVWRDVTAKAPQNPRGYVNLGLALELANKPRQAIESYHHAIRIDPNYEQLDTVYSNMGAAYQLLGNLERATECYGNAVALNPKNDKAQTNLGIAMILQGQVPDALRQFEIALALKPSSAERHTNIGQALVLLKRREEAVRHFQTALKLDPKYERARSNLKSLNAPYE